MLNGKDSSVLTAEAIISDVQVSEELGRSSFRVVDSFELSRFILHRESVSSAKQQPSSLDVQLPRCQHIAGRFLT